MTSVQGGLLRLAAAGIDAETAVLATPQHHWLNPYQLSTVNQQTPWRSMAEKSCQQIYYSVNIISYYIYSSGNLLHLSQKSSTRTTFSLPLSTIFHAMKHSWRVVQWLRTRPHPKCHGRPMTKRVLRQRQMQYRNNQTGTVVNLILTPNQTSCIPYANGNNIKQHVSVKVVRKETGEILQDKKPFLLPSFFAS